MSKRGLGRGFDSLIPTQLVEEEFDVQAPVDNAGKRVSGDEVLLVSPDLVDPNPHQPRTEFNQAELKELADSIKIHGILQPLVVGKAGDRYQLIAGERRLRAAKLAGEKTVPVIVRSFDEQQKLELALIENIQRADLNPIETATAYRKLIDQFNLTVDELAKRVGKERPTVSNTMRLLNLPLEAKRAVAEGKLSEGHARVLLTIEDAERQQELLNLIVDKGWTVREAEEYARGLRESKGSHEQAQKRISGQSELTRTLGNYLGTKVTQQSTAKGGKLIIEYYSEEELDRIFRQIRGEL
jgi:ParB family chromosome partitioning protein